MQKFAPESTEQILKQVINVKEELQDWVPHEYPMIFVDEVIEASATWGKAKIILDKDKIFLSSEKKIEPSSAVVEIMAQSMGFIGAVQSKYKLRNDINPAAVAYLGAVDGLELSESNLNKIRNEKFLIVEVKEKRSMPPLRLVMSQLLLGSDPSQKVASAQMKIFTLDQNKESSSN